MAAVPLLEDDDNDGEDDLMIVDNEDRDKDYKPENNEENDEDYPEIGDDDDDFEIPPLRARKAKKEQIQTKKQTTMTSQKIKEG